MFICPLLCVMGTCEGRCITEICSTTNTHTPPMKTPAMEDLVGKSHQFTWTVSDVHAYFQTTIDCILFYTVGSQGPMWHDPVLSSQLTPNSVSSGYKTSPEMMGDSWPGGPRNCALTRFSTVYSTPPTTVNYQPFWLGKKLNNKESTNERDEKDWSIHFNCLLPNVWEWVSLCVCACKLTYIPACTFKTGRTSVFSQRKVEFHFWYCEIDIEKGKNKTKQHSFKASDNILWSCSLELLLKNITLFSDISWGLVLFIQTGERGCLWLGLLGQGCAHPRSPSP